MVSKGEKFSGFADLQVNGYSGIDFNNPGLDPQQFLRASYRLLQDGVTTFCPTVITNTKENAGRILHAMDIALKGDPVISQMVPCIHLEAYTSSLDGYRGAHPKDETGKGYIRRPDINEFEQLQRSAGGRIGIVTLSAEHEGVLNFIRYLTQQRIVVAIGHTAASYDQIKQAVDAGAVLSTHLGNGMPRFPDRTDNQILFQMALIRKSGRLKASIIADGQHIKPDALRSMVDILGIENIVLVTDAMAGAGAPVNTEYELADIKVRVDKEGIARSPENPQLLAGSTLTMRRAVENLVRFVDVPFDKALHCASERPRRFLGKYKPGDYPFEVEYLWNERSQTMEIKQIKSGFPSSNSWDPSEQLVDLRTS